MLHATLCTIYLAKIQQQNCIQYSMAIVLSMLTHFLRPKSPYAKAPFHRSQVNRPYDSVVAQIFKSSEFLQRARNCPKILCCSSSSRLKAGGLHADVRVSDSTRLAGV